LLANHTIHAHSPTTPQRDAAASLMSAISKGKEYFVLFSLKFIKERHSIFGKECALTVAPIDTITEK